MDLALKRRSVILVISIMLIVLAAIVPVIIQKYEENKIILGDHDMVLSINETLDLFIKRINSIDFCVITRSCELYALDIAVIAKPSSDNRYNVYIEVTGDNYTRSSYLLTNNIVISEIRNFLHCIQSGYIEWLNTEKRLSIHLDVGLGFYNSSKDSLTMEVRLPTFKCCGGLCGGIYYLNASFYIDKEKYIAYQLTRLDLKRLIEEGYIEIEEQEDGTEKLINPPVAITRGSYVEPIIAVPTTELLSKDSLDKPIIATFHIVTTNQSVLMDYLKRMDFLGPLANAVLSLTYIGEISGSNYTMFVELSHEIKRRAARDFLERLGEVLRTVNGSQQLEVTYVENARGGDYYLAYWGDMSVRISIGSLSVEMRDVPDELIRALIDIVRQCITLT